MGRARTPNPARRARSLFPQPAPTMRDRPRRRSGRTPPPPPTLSLPSANWSMQMARRDFSGNITFHPEVGVLGTSAQDKRVICAPSCSSFPPDTSDCCPVPGPPPSPRDGRPAAALLDTVSPAPQTGAGVRGVPSPGAAPQGEGISSPTGS